MGKHDVQQNLTEKVFTFICVVVRLLASKHVFFVVQEKS